MKNNHTQKSHKNQDGYFISKHNIIYVQGSVDGKFYRKSTSKKATKDNLNWIKKHHYEVLLKLTVKKEILDPGTSISLEQFGKQILENTSLRKSPNQQRDVISKFDNHILPHFRNFNLTDVKSSDVEYWQNQLLLKLSSSSVKKCKEILNLIFKKALADDIVIKNYIELADNVQVTHNKKEPYTEHELRLLLEHSTGWFHTFLVLVMSTGIRTGEAIGLKWSDIIFEENYIDLQRSISKGQIVDDSSFTNKTKNHKRLIPLDNATVKELFKHYQTKLNDVWVFVNKDFNHFYDGANVNRYHWKPLLAKLHIKDRSMYALRHSFITIMKNNGASDMWLKSVIGHKQSSKVMDNVYFTFNDEVHKVNNSNNFFNVLEKAE